MNIEIRSPAACDRDALRALWHEAFGDTEEFLDLFEATAYSPARSRALFCEGALSCALYWLDSECRGEKIAYLYAIATARERRGQGFCRRLMQDTHEHLRSLGYSAAMLVPSEPSLFGFYERIGYRMATKISEICCQSADEAIELVRISAQEYARLRRKFLPEGGVVQEKENLSYLAAQAELYRTEGALLAVRCDGETVDGIELLGDECVAPRIVRALGKTKGRFRTVGTDRDFSMILPLDPDISIIPTYFGLAFD